MSKDNPTVKERLAVVETEVKHINTNIKEFKEECSENFTDLDNRLNSYNKTLVSIKSSIDDKLQGSFSGKEKALIITAVIAGVFSVINTALMLLRG